MVVFGEGSHGQGERCSMIVRSGAVRDWPGARGAESMRKEQGVKGGSLSGVIHLRKSSDWAWPGGNSRAIQFALVVPISAREYPGGHRQNPKFPVGNHTKSKMLPKSGSCRRL